MKDGYYVTQSMFTYTFRVWKANGEDEEWETTITTTKYDDDDVLDLFKEWKANMEIYGICKWSITTN